MDNPMAQIEAALDRHVRYVTNQYTSHNECDRSRESLLALIRSALSLLPVQGMTYAVYYAEFRAARKASGIKARPHDLRHTCASWMLHAGADSIHVRDMLGHSSVNVTQRYIHNKAAHLAEVVGRIGSTQTAHGQKVSKAKKRRAKTRKPRKSGAL